MGKQLGVSKSTVQRVWSANDIRPHRLRTFKLSNDPQFAEAHVLRGMTQIELGQQAAGCRSIQQGCSIRRDRCPPPDLLREVGCGGRA